MRLQVALACIWLALGATQATAGAVGCGSSSAPKKTNDTGTWGPADVPLFELTLDGKLWRLGFDGRARKLVSDHGLKNTNGYMSAEGRWLAYSGLKSGRQQTWLFDMRTGSDRLVHTANEWGSGLPKLSPDGRTIAILDEPDERNPDTKRVGLHLVDTSSGKATYLGLPSKSRLNRTHWFGSAYWSVDSSDVYLDLSGRGAQGEAYRVSSGGDFEAISRRPNKRHDEPAFIVGGRIMAVAEQVSLQSNRAWATDPSPDGSMIATVDRNSHALSVRDENGKVRPIANGSYSDCMGESIEIKGWVGKRYLVYSIDQTQFLHDTQSGKSRVLMDRWVRDGSYFWPTVPNGP